MKTLYALYSGRSMKGWCGKQQPGKYTSSPTLRKHPVGIGRPGTATSGINYLSEVFGGQNGDRRSGTLRGSLGLVPFGRANDSRHGCMARDPFGGMTEEVSDYGYRYQMSRSERPGRKTPERFSLAEFGREVVTGFVMGGLASAAFYGAGRAVEAVKSSVGSGCEGGSSTVGRPAQGQGFSETGYSPRPGERTFNGYVEQNANPEISLYTDSASFNNNNGNIGDNLNVLVPSLGME